MNKKTWIRNLLIIYIMVLISSNISVWAKSPSGTESNTGSTPDTDGSQVDTPIPGSSGTTDDPDVETKGFKGSRKTDGNKKSYEIEEAEEFHVGNWKFGSIFKSFIELINGRFQRGRIKSKIDQTLEFPNPIAHIAVPTDTTYSTIDTDNDGLSDIQENLINTDPNKADTDDDGLSDAEELLVYNTNPIKEDILKINNTIYTGMTLIEYLESLYAEWLAGNYDGDEFIQYMNYEDSDNDGVSDYVEIQLNLNLSEQDTDSDGLTDGFEMSHGLDPLNYDTDSDGLDDAIDTSPIANNTIPQTSDSTLKIDLNSNESMLIDMKTNAGNLVGEGFNVTTADNIVIQIGANSSMFKFITTQTFDYSILNSSNPAIQAILDSLIGMTDAQALITLTGLLAYDLDGYLRNQIEHMIAGLSINESIIDVTKTSTGYTIDLQNTILETSKERITATTLTTVSLTINNDVECVSLPPVGRYEYLGSATMDALSIYENSKEFFFCIRKDPNQNFNKACTQCGIIDNVNKTMFFKGEFEFEKQMQDNPYFMDAIDSDSNNEYNLVFDNKLDKITGSKADITISSLDSTNFQILNATWFNLREAATVKHTFREFKIEQEENATFTATENVLKAVSDSGQVFQMVAPGSDEHQNILNEIRDFR